MKAKITLSFQTENDAERVLSVIKPDNSPLPEGLEIECFVHDDQLSIMLHCTRGINSLGSTIEDILSAIDLSLRTVESFGHSKKDL